MLSKAKAVPKKTHSDVVPRSNQVSITPGATNIILGSLQNVELPLPLSYTFILPLNFPFPQFQSMNGAKLAPVQASISIFVTQLHLAASSKKTTFATNCARSTFSVNSVTCPLITDNALLEECLTATLTQHSSEVKAPFRELESNTSSMMKGLVARMERSPVSPRPLLASKLGFSTSGQLQGRGTR